MSWSREWSYHSGHPHPVLGCICGILNLPLPIQLPVHAPGRQQVIFQVFESLQHHWTPGQSSGLLSYLESHCHSAFQRKLLKEGAKTCSKMAKCERVLAVKLYTWGTVGENKVRKGKSWTFR